MSDTEIRTHSGAYVDFANPDPDTIVIEDIAIGLARRPRFGGHMQCFFSVAQHSVNVSFIAEDYAINKLKFNPIGPLVKQIALGGLLHDASEAYMSDIPSPLKRLLPDYKEVEMRLQTVINRKFGLPTLAHEGPSVKYGDVAALFHERDYMIAKGIVWNMENMHPGTSMLDCFPDFRPLSSEEAYDAFMDRFNSLYNV